MRSRIRVSSLPNKFKPSTVADHKHLVRPSPIQYPIVDLGDYIQPKLCTLYEIVLVEGLCSVRTEMIVVSLNTDLHRQIKFKFSYQEVFKRLITVNLELNCSSLRFCVLYS